jgi:hypothetical protein
MSSRLNNTDNFDYRFNKFLEKVEEKIKTKDTEYTKHSVDFTLGKRYIKVISLTSSSCTSALRRESVFCFIDTTNGNVLKASSWKAPETKNPRSNIGDEDFGESGIDYYGAIYLR